MKRLLLTITSLFLAMFFAIAEELPHFEPQSCTSIMVGRKASTDGSVITSHTCDGNYRTWVNIVPASTFKPGDVVEIYKNRLHSESINGSKGTLKGTIPQVEATFQFVDTAYPCLNEKQLGIGETTIEGRKELVNPQGMFMIEELEKIVLQRCATARDAIKLIDILVKEYGYGDWGECLTIADKNEVWHFEIFGQGPDKIGGVWAAVRIPDDHVGVSANISRIAELDLKDSDRYMASENVFEVAKELGYWDGKSTFKFWEAYAGGNYFGEDKSFHIREYFILNALAPSLNLSYDSRELPISVKPDEKVSVEKVMRLLMETYTGSRFDVLQNLKINDSTTAVAANPWMLRDTRDMINAVKPGTVPNNRNIAVPQCSYSTVIQLHRDLPDAIGGILWLSFDNPGQSPRIPVFCGTTELPDLFDICGQPRYDENAIVWKYRKTNKMATVRWGATKNEMFGAIDHFIEKGQREIPFVREQYKKIVKEQGEQAANQFLTDYTSDFAGATILTWDELYRTFWKRFARGF